jgi:hypothetical protein
VKVKENKYKIKKIKYKFRVASQDRYNIPPPPAPGEAIICAIFEGSFKKFAKMIG